MDSTQIVGEKIKSLRETREISVAELAERTALSVDIRILSECIYNINDRPSKV